MYKNICFALSHFYPHDDVDDVKAGRKRNNFHRKFNHGDLNLFFGHKKQQAARYKFTTKFL
jgi:hypothetical protein